VICRIYTTTTPCPYTMNGAISSSLSVLLVTSTISINCGDEQCAEGTATLIASKPPSPTTSVSKGPAALHTEDIYPVSSESSIRGKLISSITSQSSQPLESSSLGKVISSTPSASQMSITNTLPLISPSSGAGNGSVLVTFTGGSAGTPGRVYAFSTLTIAIGMWMLGWTM
jgi:hypothetical protein